MRITLTLIMLAATLTAVAKTPIYRSVDAQGNVLFSDIPPERQANGTGVGDAVELSTSNRYAPPSGAVDDTGRELWLVESPGGGETISAPAYIGVRITQPGNDEAVRANDGTVSVRGTFEPELAPGHQIRLLLDGADRGLSSTADFTLTNVDRGTHTVSIAIVDEEGLVLLRSAEQTFHVLRAHR